MKVLNEKKVCFIICANNERQLEECLLYINLLVVPEGYEIEVLTIDGATSMTSGYNEAMNASDAKYKVYMHQDVFIMEKYFIEKFIKVFKKDKKIGLIGLVGTENLSKDGVMWHGKRCGDFYKLNDKDDYIIKIKRGIREVEAVDGFLMITCQDIPWREDIFDGWDFYDVSQCLEFRRAGYKVVVPAQNPVWANHDCGPQKLWNYDVYRKKLLEEYTDFFATKKYLRILFLHSEQIALCGLQMAFEEMGHYVHAPECKIHVDDYYEYDEMFVSEVLEEGHYDLVATYDFSQGVSEACEKENVKYLAWVYDSPLLQLYTKEARNKNNYICVFERNQKNRLKDKGIHNLFYYPLSAEVDAFGVVKITPRDEKKYRSEISFVGNLYSWGEYERVFSEASEELQREAETIVHSTQCIWNGEKSIFGKSSDLLLEHMISMQDDSYWLKYNIEKDYFCESMVLGVKVSEIERVAILNKLAEKHEVVLYTRSEDTSFLKNVIVKPEVSYLQVMPKIFHLSKINLNITSRTIETGISQRVWDVLAVGGFLITNYQPELEEYFEIGKDLEVFHDLNELEEKVDYYLKHEEQRIRIAMNGYKKVRENHKCAKRMKQVLEEVFGYKD